MSNKQKTVRMLTSVSVENGAFTANQQYPIEARLADQWIKNGWAVEVAPSK